MRYTLDSARKRVRHAGHIVGTKSIKLTHWPGIKVWGALDFLKRHGYSVTKA